MASKREIFHREEEELVAFMLAAQSPVVVKRGLQFLCAEVLRGRVFHNRVRLIGLLQSLKETSDARLRGWLYNAIAVLRAKEFVDYVTYQLLYAEADEENRAWAMAALFVIASPELIAKVVRDRHVDFFDSASELAAQLYYEGDLFNTPQPDLLPRLENRPIFAKWYALLFGYGRTDRRSLNLEFPDRDFVSALNTHHDPEVVEYSLWALHRAGSTDFSDAKIDPHRMVLLPPNARRWAYRLLAKNQRSYRANKELLFHAAGTETHVVAREGVAIGLAEFYDPGTSRAMLEWYAREKEELIRLALLNHFVKYAARNRDYEELIARQLEAEHANAVGQKFIISATSNLPQAHRLHQRLRSIQHRYLNRSDQLVMIFEGGNAMDDNKRNVTNVAIGGGVINVSGINLGEIHRATFGAISTIAAQAGLKEALERYANQLEIADGLSENEKAVALAAVQDVVVASSNNQANSHRSLAIHRAIACLRGLISAAPTATKFIDDTTGLIDMIHKTFGL